VGTVRSMRGRMLTVVVGVFLMLSPTAAAKSKDETPPTFAGLVSATTCVPGPIVGLATSYTLRWEAASDNRTPSNRIVYDVYQAATPGGEDFSAPTYTTQPGETSFVTPPLPADKAAYFVVRARDRAGNSDANKVERAGENLCD
jgi:hypothetical protein